MLRFGPPRWQNTYYKEEGHILHRKLHVAEQEEGSHTVKKKK